MYFVTVITVTYNCDRYIHKTIESVKKQDYLDFEHLIVDGQSSDKTVNIINCYADDATNVRWISEPDLGIYDAMNKAVNMAKSEYIIFMNAGDEFADEFVLSRFAAKARETNADVIYGNVIDYLPSLNEKFLLRKAPAVLTKKYFLKRNGLCHQSIFAKKHTLDEYKFNWRKYKIAADKDWVLHCFVDGKIFQYLDYPICLYDRTGISSAKENRDQIKTETDLMLCDHMKFLGNIVYLIRKIKSRNLRDKG